MPVAAAKLGLIAASFDSERHLVAASRPGNSLASSFTLFPI